MRIGDIKNFLNQPNVEFSEVMYWRIFEEIRLYLEGKLDVTFFVLLHAERFYCIDDQEYSILQTSELHTGEGRITITLNENEQSHPSRQVSLAAITNKPLWILSGDRNVPLSEPTSYINAFDGGDEKVSIKYRSRSRKRDVIMTSIIIPIARQEKASFSVVNFECANYLEFDRDRFEILQDFAELLAQLYNRKKQWVHNQRAHESHFSNVLLGRPRLKSSDGRSKGFFGRLPRLAGFQILGTGAHFIYRDKDQSIK